MKVSIAAGGRFHALHLANQLKKKSCLDKLYTCSYSSKDSGLIPQNNIINNDALKFLDKLYLKFLFKVVEPSSFYVFKDNLFDTWLKGKIKESNKLDIFVGWAHYWLKSLPEIKKTGAKIILEAGSRHILDQTALLEEEYCRFGVKLNPVHDDNIDKILAEYEAADYVMTPSKNVYDSFVRKGIPQKKLLKVPYGVDIDGFYYDRKSADSFFRVIFVGSIGLQKGVQYLVQAWNNLNLPIGSSELLLVGPVEKSFMRVLKTMRLKENIRFLGPVSRDVLVNEYRKSTVFVLPSIQDGLAMVQAEAMASGLPVICSTNTGGEELIEDGIEGFIVPIRQVDPLMEKILWCYENRKESLNLGLSAQEKAKKFTWDHYGDKIVEAYNGIAKL